MGNVRRFRYQQQDTPQTLAQGLDEYYDGHAEVSRPDALPEADRELFRFHDMCHVIFGLDTDIVDEGLVDTWTMFGTTVGMKRYVRYLRQNQQAKAIFKQVGVGALLKATFGSIAPVTRVIKRARRQTEKLPWDGLAVFLDTPLVELRARFGVKLLDRPAAEASRAT